MTDVRSAFRLQRFPSRSPGRRPRGTVLVAALLLPLLLACGPSREELEARMGAVRSALAATLQGDDLPADARNDLEHRRAWNAVRELYGGEEPETVWVDGRGPRDRVDALIAVLAEEGGTHAASEDSSGDGAPPEAGEGPDDYASARLAELRDAAAAAVEEESDDLGRRLADLELAASYAFLARAIHAVQGRVDPSSLNVQWYTEGRKAKPLELLTRVRDGAEPAELLSGLEPDYPEYARLLEARDRYREIVAAGGWPSIPAGDGVLEAGAEGARVAALRQRLAAEGYLDAGSASASDGGTAAYDKEVAGAVERFQERHGLEVDGKVGGGTLEALNVPAEDRLRTLEVNLERWRWMPGELGDRYVLVNIPEYRLRAVRDGDVELEMDVIVGKPLHETPVFSDTMTFLVLNPEWNLPQSIADSEVVPKILADPGYAERQGIEVVTDGGERVPASTVLGRVERTVDDGDDGDDGGGFFSNLFGGDDGPDTVVRQVSELPEGYRLRQAPGRQNPLGQVKFMFPNEHNIYLHDTPADSLFANTERGFSHGCIRLERPLELADYVLRDDGDWSPERIRETVRSGERTQVPLPEDLPVHLTYFTAWVDEDGRTHFRDDLYGHDERLARALAEEAPLTLDLPGLRGGGGSR